jgi:sugar lactone lactonase YvrE
MTENPRRYRATPATAERYDHAEGPGWDARTGRLFWIDQYEGGVLVGAYDPARRQVTPVRAYSLGHPVGAVAPTRGDDWIVAVGLGFGRLAADGDLTMLDQPEASAAVRMRMNDGKCDARGRFWAGSMAFDKVDGAGSLYRLDPDLVLTTVLTDVTISNGLAWSDDGATMYYIDTPTQRIDRFRVTPDGALADRTPVASVADGFPDGMCIDVEGCLWVALWGASAVHRYSPDGDLLAVVDVDAPQVSSCAFGGPGLSTLFITTSQEGMDDARRASDPHSGRLFCVDVEPCGRPAAPFGAS